MPARLCAVVAVAVLAGCASSPSSTGAPPPPQTIRVGAAGMGGRATIIASSNLNVATVAHPLADVWRVLPAAYDSLGITKGLIEPATYVISNQGLKMRERLGKTRLSRFIECGTTQIGPNADSYEVFLTITTQLSAAAEGSTTIATTVDASARPLAFAQQYARCSSKGLLEQSIAELVKLQLQ